MATIENVFPQKVLELKGYLSYRDFSKAIKEKTGEYIPFSNLQRLATGEQEPTDRVRAILAQYADKPLSWFYEVGQPDAVAEARERYFVPTGNPREDARRRELYDMFIKTGREMSLRDLEQLVKIARAIAADDLKYERKEE